jgi:hypothetical protein
VNKEERFVSYTLKQNQSDQHLLCGSSLNAYQNQDVKTLQQKCLIMALETQNQQFDFDNKFNEALDPYRELVLMHPDKNVALSRSFAVYQKSGG